jgi:predicted alpha/beta hydrolase family esterase
MEDDIGYSVFDYRQKYPVLFKIYSLPSIYYLTSELFNMNPRTLILPGIGNSDQDHWQSLWQSAQANFLRVEQRDWEHPVCSDWVTTLEQAVTESHETVLLVAHSLGCLLVAHWAAQTKQQIKGALLVAPPSPDTIASAAIFESLATGFLPVPMQSFNFPSIVVASSNDPYSDLDFTMTCAKAWGSSWVNIGAAGHINASSGLGAWNDGFNLYRQLAA